MSTYAQRLSRARAEMLARSIDTLILTPGSAMRYLSGFSEPGFERLLALIIPEDVPEIFLVPAINADQVGENPAGILDLRVWDDSHGWESLLEEMGEELDLGVGLVGIDDDMPARFVLRIQDLLPTTVLKSAGPIFAALRAVKDAQEIASLQRAADATDAQIETAFAHCRPGAAEREVATAIEAGFASVSADRSFETIVAAGANGASPHHHPGTTQIATGDIVVLDFGARVDGYCGDITRTVAVGKASDEARRVYDVVYSAYQAGVDAVQLGASAHDVDAAARAVIIEAGYGEFFLHRTGHGIGLDDHEEPFIVAGNQTNLLPGHCFSVEPGIYLPGQFGIRLENIVTVADDGRASVLNRAIPPELPVV
jgi:Xaa-Pro aminopeptidase